MATTHASTRTTTRIRLLKTQISRALRRTTSISDETLGRLLLGLDRRWLRVFTVYAFDSKKFCRAELSLRIDWNEHSAQIHAGKATISVNGSWVDDTAIEVDEATRAFEGYVEDFGLRTEWSVTYTSDVYNNGALLNQVRKELGLKTMDPVRWAGQKIGTKFTVPELSELDVELYMIEDE